MSKSVNVDMTKFMEPASVALFGVSRRTGEGAYNILEHLIGYGYAGEIYPVNPNTSEVLGVKTYSNIREANGARIDLGVINLPRDLVPGIVRECAEAGIRNVIIATQGFADANDEKGKLLQKEIDSFVRDGRVRIVGPNSLGTANPFINFSSSFMKVDMDRVGVGVICQSGVFFGFRDIGVLGKGIDLANCCDVDFVDALEYYENDPQTRAIVLHIEGMRDSQKFIKAVRRITPGKPVLALKAARTEAAARAVESHTGSLVGQTSVWDAALRQAGVIPISSPAELGDTARALAALPTMKGKRIGLITGSGGFGVIMVDCCAREGLEVARWSEKTLAKMREIFPPWQEVGNPLDILPTCLILKKSLTTVMTDAVQAVLDDPGADALLMMWGIPTRGALNRVAEIMFNVVEKDVTKPIICCLMGHHAPEAKTVLEKTGRIIAVHTPDRAALILANLYRYSAFRNGL